MSTHSTRRQFINLAAAGTAYLGAGHWGLCGGLPPVSAAETELNPRLVQFNPNIEPLVRLLEDTSRESVLEEVAHRIRNKTSYREILASLLLAGVRNVQPRPSVGFKFHAVLVVNSAHLASLAAPDTERWLPIFWAIDYFKAQQAREVQASGWRMTPVNESLVPAAHQARAVFVDAMDHWNDAVADAAIAGLCRTAGSHEIFELLVRYGARDYRSIGHKAIYVANSWRTLQCIGWQYAEPVLRSLVHALLNHGDDPNPVDSDLEADRPWRDNGPRAGQLRAEWRGGSIDNSATRDMLATLHDDDSAAAADQAVEIINRGVSPQSVWDAVLVGSGELLMRQPGIIGLHTLTTSNALHYAYQSTANDDTRRMLLLQASAFLPMFQKSAAGRGEVANIRVDDLATDSAAFDEPLTIDKIMSDVSHDPQRAAQSVLRLMADGGDARALIQSARQLTFFKGRDAHDYKFSSAVLEDYYHVSPDWREKFLALSVFNLRGTGDPDTELVQRTRAALAS